MTRKNHVIRVSVQRYHLGAGLDRRHVPVGEVLGDLEPAGNRQHDEPGRGRVRITGHVTADSMRQGGLESQVT